MSIYIFFPLYFAGELAEAFRSRTDVHFGIYFSLFEWFHPLLLFDQQNGYKTREYPKVSLLFSFANTFYVLYLSGGFNPD